MNGTGEARAPIAFGVPARAGSTALVLALVGLDLVMWLHLAPFVVAPASADVDWLRVFLAGALISAAIATILAVALVARSSRRDAHALALALASTTVAALLLVSILAGSATGSHVPMNATPAIPAALALGCAAFLRFSVLFPRHLSAAELGRLGRTRPVDDSLARAESVFRRAPHEPAGGARLIDRPLDRFVGRLPARWRARAETIVVPDAGGLLTRTHVFWALALGFALVPYVLWLALDAEPVRVTGLLDTVGLALFVVWLVMVGAGFVLGIAILRLGSVLAESDDRRRARWIIESINAGAWGALAAAPFVMLDLFLLEHSLVRLVPGFVYGLLPALVLLGLAVAVFHRGALEPSLVIRRGALYSLFGLALVFAFAVVEELVTTHIVARFALPDGTGTALASGFVAVAFSVLVGRVHRGVGHHLARREEQISGAQPQSRSEGGAVPLVKS